MRKLYTHKSRALTDSDAIRTHSLYVRGLHMCTVIPLFAFASLSASGHTGVGTYIPQIPPNQNLCQFLFLLVIALSLARRQSHGTNRISGRIGALFLSFQPSHQLSRYIFPVRLLQLTCKITTSVPGEIIFFTNIIVF